MDVHPNKSIIPQQGLPNAGAKKRIRKAEPGDLLKKSPKAPDVSENFELHEAIRESLEAMPEVRRHLVETGRELADDKNYPSAENLDELGRLALTEFLEERASQEEEKK